MEKNRYAGPSRRKAKTDFKIKDKAIMGGYFNLARLNFFKTMMVVLNGVDIDISRIKEDYLPRYLDYLCLVVKGECDIDKDVIQNYRAWVSELKLSQDDQFKLQQLLDKYFPFLAPVMASEASYNIYSRARDVIGDNDPRARREPVGKYVPADVMRGVGLAQSLDVITCMAHCLNDSRDYYTHFNPYNTIEQQCEKFDRQWRIAKWLRVVRDASRRIDKRRNGLSTREMEFLTGVDRMTSQVSKDGDGNIVKDSKNRPVKFFVEYPDYYFRIDGERPLVDAAGHSVDDDKPRLALSDFGMVFFCTLFLEKNQARLMQEELALFENGPYDGSRPDDDKKNSILREMFSIYRIRLPRGRRLDPGDDDTLLAMDMLNELRKCPMELYDVLGRAGRRYFEDEIKHPNEKTPEVFKRLRSTDRFPFLALRYIDATRCLDGIRFHVQLGKYRFRFYDKTTIDGDVTVRSLQREINGYGRLQDVERARREKYASMLQQSVQVATGEEDITIANFVPDTPQSTPYITDNAASYNIHNNRIGLYWDRDGESTMLSGDDKLYLPDLAVDDAGKATVEMPAPRATLSVRDLPAMVFYLHLCKRYALELPSAEEIIIKKHDQLVRFFDDVSQAKLKPVGSPENLDAVLADYDLTSRDIPSRLRLYLCGQLEEDENEYRLDSHGLELLSRRHKRIARQLDRLRQAREMVGDKQNTFGKKSFVGISHRLMAEQLAKSIIEWQPAVDNGRNKLTGLNYQRMIAFMASYDDAVPFEKLKDMFSRARLLEGSAAHPFLPRVLNHRPVNIEVLYELYFKEEKRRIQDLLDNEVDSRGNVVEYCLSHDADLSRVPFLHVDRKRFQHCDDAYCRELAARYLHVEGRCCSVELPDGLFTPYILKALKGHRFASNLDLQACLQDSDRNRNAAYLMSAYLEHVLHDASQPFYMAQDGDSRFARCYDLFAILQNEKINNELQPCPLSPVEINRRLTVKSSNGKSKQIDAEIEELMADMKRKAEKRISRDHMDDNQATKALKNCQAECEKKRQALKHKIADVKKNERTIRRYKTQDMALMLMAQDILGRVLTVERQGQDETGLLKLQHVCDPGFLNIPFTAKFKRSVKVDKKTSRDVWIVQENMALKNYGLFYQLFNDERVDTLLAKLEDQQVVRYSELNSELAAYDHNRTKMFDDVQRLERLAFDENTAVLSDPLAAAFFVNKDKGFAARNNFKRLLELLREKDPDRLDDEVITWLYSVRNAFCHNSYNIDMRQINKELPKIINQIIEQVNHITSGIARR